jgi:hypothetical protein
MILIDQFFNHSVNPLDRVIHGFLDASSGSMHSPFMHDD